ncbi:hypothetical protein CDD81_5367 [Ophiocordyceps australis]|uniref:Mediator of RNA polymerase II transcription subunit 7 n=1 Tax=Ophiocordyceps australis TaxID=1399860 RepID=A0A2C5XA43_9HYPO|nr:hypothetical protein CDD81_5367 [Ophiocordyceps australis]
MADQEPLSLASTFPNPPPFWRDFTPENIARIEELREKHARQDKDASGAVLRLQDVPPDLANLEAPPEPTQERWRVFGDQYLLDDRLPSLEEQGITNLFAQRTASASASASIPSSPLTSLYDRAIELKRLAKSLLLNFVELTGLLARHPSHTEAKLADMRTLFVNMHHSINEYRPHQARESAIELLQEHLDRTHAETVAVRSQVDRARSVLEGLGSLNIAAKGQGAEATEPEAVREEAEALERERQTWKDAMQDLGEVMA